MLIRGLVACFVLAAVSASAAPDDDRAIDDELAPWRERVAEACAARGKSRAELQAMRRMFEEIEISRYAPKLPRAFPASEKRLESMLQPADA